jgi:uncharacterized FlaG/YvyC family protein
VTKFDRLDLDSLMRTAYAQFSVDRDSGKMAVKIIDARTNEIVMEIPSPALLHVAAQVEAYLKARQRSGM